MDFPIPPSSWWSTDTVTLSESESSHPAHEGGDEVVDDIPAEEEGVDEATVFVTKRLSCDGGL